MAKMNKIPCIKCTSELWEYIKPYLEEWHYSIYWVDSSEFKTRKILVINRFGKFGDCSNYETSAELTYNRELISNVEEFLERAAELKGFTYKRKGIMKIHGIEIKPGIVLRGITTKNKEIKVVAFPIEGETLGFVDVTRGGWSTNYRDLISEMLEIKDLSKGGYIDSGDTLWEKPKEIILTMDEIAEKFGYSVEQIKIVKQ